MEKKWSFFYRIKKKKAKYIPSMNWADNIPVIQKNSDHSTSTTSSVSEEELLELSFRVKKIKKRGNGH